MLFPQTSADINCLQLQRLNKWILLFSKSNILFAKKKKKIRVWKNQKFKNKNTCSWGIEFKWNSFRILMVRFSIYYYNNITYIDVPIYGSVGF